ncbi:MAG: prolipoprotein diacylglyceryl transferase [Acidimicrobiales bacterium]|jgi:prolipoprotein diacylglyceryl transferase|nr:prolipoprotein diacylglyceryl transferase [Acidimicrobiales bacterium]
MVPALVASLPSPSDSEIVLGPLHLRAYGLMIALGVLAAVEIARRRWAARGGDPEDMVAIALWAVPAGLVGARVYHLLTDWSRYEGRREEMLQVWNGGLGIPGGLVAGVLVGVWVAHRRGIRLPVGLDAVAPAIPVAQAVGRLGNWFNQEIFGRPTDLPWALEVDDDIARRAGEAAGTTFHPTFLYEGLWNLALAGLLVLLDRRRVVRPGRIFALYVAGYAIGRFLVESLRIDEATEILGLRVNTWTSLVTFTAVAIFLAVRGLRRRPGDDDVPYLDGHRFDGSPEEPSPEEALPEAPMPEVASLEEPSPEVASSGDQREDAKPEP